MTNKQMKHNHLEPRENKKKNNKERPQNQHVGNSVKSVTAQRRSSEVGGLKRDKRKAKQRVCCSRNRASCRFQVLQKYAYAHTLTHMLQGVIPDLWCP